MTDEQWAVANNISCNDPTLTNPSIASDLIERLLNDEVRQGPDADPLCVEAADALSRLTREVDELREALQSAAPMIRVAGVSYSEMIAARQRIDRALSRSSGRVSDAG